LIIENYSIMNSHRRTKKTLKKPGLINKLSFGLFKRLRSNALAYRLILTGASAKKLSPYYHTFIYCSIRGLSSIILGFKSYLPRLSVKSLAATVILAMLVTQIFNLGAYEAHIINVTAKVVNDVPEVDPLGGQFCDNASVEVIITSSLVSASIIYTLDDSDPVCGVNGLLYTGPFNLTQSATLKTRTCHDGKQSVIVTQVFEIEQQFCPCEPQPEICDGIDNDCDGIIDNVYETVTASSSPFEARLNNGQIVTPRVEKSDNIYARQNVNQANTKYIYLDWLFNDIPADAAMGSTTLIFEHQEKNIDLAVEWFNGSDFTEVCQASSSISDLLSTCDLTPYINTPDKAGTVNLRLRLTQADGDGDGKDCHHQPKIHWEKLDWANLELSYTHKVDCHPCDKLVINKVYYDDHFNYQDKNCNDGQDDWFGCKNNGFDDCYNHQGKNEWLEIYNTCDNSMNISGWKIRDNYSTVIIPKSEPIPPKGFAIITPDDSTWDLWPIPDEVIKIVLGKNFGNTLGDDGDRVILKTPKGKVVDALSYGNDHSIFNLPIPLPKKNYLLARVPTGYDTDQASDFKYLSLPKVKVISPNGHEIWTIGETYEIKWLAQNPNGPDDALKIDLYYSAHSGDDWALIAKDEANDGSYFWRLPLFIDDYFVMSGKARIKVVAHGPENFMVVADDMSDQDFCPPINYSLLTEEEKQLLALMNLPDYDAASNLVDDETFSKDNPDVELPPPNLNLPNDQLDNSTASSSDSLLPAAPFVDNLTGTLDSENPVIAEPDQASSTNLMGLENNQSSANPDLVGSSQPVIVNNDNQASSTDSIGTDQADLNPAPDDSSPLTVPINDQIEQGVINENQNNSDNTTPPENTADVPVSPDQPEQINQPPAVVPEPMATPETINVQNTTL